MILPIPGASGNNVLDSTGILSLNKLPKSLVIVGTGVIGLEIACVMNAVGCEVTAVDILPEILPNEDREAATELFKYLKKSGIKFEMGCKVVRIEEVAGAKRTIIETDGKERKIESEYVMIGVGREPISDVAKEIGIKCDRKGFILVDEYMETSIEGVFAAGDVTGKYLLAHSAYEEAETAAQNCINKGKKVRLEIMPRCIFTMPCLAAVGMSEEDAIKKSNITTGKFSFSSDGKALAAGMEQGFVKWIAEKVTGKMLGCIIVGGEGVELISSAVVAINKGQPFKTLSR